VIFDEEAGRILDEQSGYSKSAVFDSEKYKSIAGLKVGNTYNKPKKSLDNIRGFTDEGGASRYFLNVDNTDDEDFDTSTNHNPILMARKPFKGGVANNVVRWGTGGINIDESRIDGEPWVRDNTKGKADMYEGWGMKPNIKSNESGGRFPANVIFDEDAGKILDEQSGYSKSNTKQGNIENKGSGVFLKEDGTQATGHKHKVYPNTIQDEGGASRFFYCAKASKKDRNEGLDNFEDKFSPTMGDGIGMKEHNPDIATLKKNIHPTVKPTKLMEYLIKLITPKGGVVLDPFMGSGSTGKAAIKNDFNFIGIEREKEYFDIAKARIEHAKGSGLFAPEINQDEL
jgi:site-specific DNA-methyltransferase (adenine-specific)